MSVYQDGLGDGPISLSGSTLRQFVLRGISQKYEMPLFFLQRDACGGEALASGWRLVNGIAMVLLSPHPNPLPEGEGVYR